MDHLTLKYGLNPHQRVARAVAADGGELPVRVVHGTPSVVNLLDSLQGWRLVREASRALGRSAAASIKHVSPAGVAVAGRLDGVTRAAFDLPGDVSAVTTAYARARDCDPRSSYGDMVAVSHPVDLDLARLLAGLVSDGIVAPGFEEGVVPILSRKKGGAFLVLEVDERYDPPEEESRDVFGVRITQERDRLRIDPATIGTVVVGSLPDDLRRDATLGLIAARYTQSNAVALVASGRTIGVAGGQQSRVDGVRLAGRRADRWRLRRHPRLTAVGFRDGVTRQDRVNALMRLVEGDLGHHERATLATLLSRAAAPLSEAERSAWLAQADRCTLASDAYLPFRDNVDAAAGHGVGCIVEGGGSVRQDEVEEACREHGMTLVRTGLRLFSH